MRFLRWAHNGVERRLAVGEWLANALTKNEVSIGIQTGPLIGVEKGL
jgi:hypothetical protein